MKIKKVIIYSIGIIFLLLTIIAIFLPGMRAARRHYPIRRSCNKMTEIVQAEYAFYDKNDGKYGTLEQLKEANLIDEQTASGENFGYKFSLVVQEDSFSLDAVPINYDSFAGSSPDSYHSDANGIIWGTDEKGKRPGKNDSIMRCENDSYGVGACGTKYTKDECYETHKVKRRQ